MTVSLDRGLRRTVASSLAEVVVARARFALARTLGDEKRRDGSY